MLFEWHAREKAEVDAFGALRDMKNGPWNTAMTVRYRHDKNESTSIQRIASLFLSVGHEKYIQTD